MPTPTPELQQTIVAYIRAGGMPHVAAEAAGLPRAMFEAWLRRGRRPAAPAELRAFADAVRQARAQARLGAEIAVFKGRPLDWLRSGPGKETPTNPGWTSNVKPGTGADERGNPLLDPELRRLFAHLLDLLEPYPDVRAGVAAACAAPIRDKTD